MGPIGPGDVRQSLIFLTELAMQTDKGAVLAAKAFEEWRHRKVMIAPLNLTERLRAAAGDSG